MNMQDHSIVYVGISRDNQHIVVSCPERSVKPIYLSHTEYQSFIWPDHNWAEVQLRIFNTARFIGWII